MNGGFKPAVLGNCSTLHIEPLRTANDDDEITWRGAELGDLQSGIPRCPKMEIVSDSHVYKISLATILDYFFVSVGDGRKRELRISAPFGIHFGIDDEDALTALAELKRQLAMVSGRQLDLFH